MIIVHSLGCEARVFNDFWKAKMTASVSSSRIAWSIVWIVFDQTSKLLAYNSIWACANEDNVVTRSRCNWLAKLPVDWIACAFNVWNWDVACDNFKSSCGLGWAALCFLSAAAI